MFALQTIIDLVDRMSGPIAEPIRRIQELTNATAAADVAMGQLEAGMKIAALGLAIGAPLALATNEAIKFEAAYANVVKTVDFSPDYGPAQLSQELLKLSNQMPIVAVGFANIAEEAGSAGIATGELTQFSGDAAKLGVAFDMAAQDAGSALGKLRINFQATQTEAMQIADATNYLSNVMASKAPDILNVLSRVGSSARLVNMTGVELAALSSAMLSTGSAPEVVSTGLNAMIGFMGAATSQSKKFQNTLEDMGMSASGVEKAIRTDAQGAILDLLKTVNASRNPLATLTDLFGREYADDIAKLSGNIGLLEGAFSHVADTSKYAGSVQKEYGVQAATTANQLQLFQNRIQNIGIILGTFLLPPLNSVIGAVGNALISFQEFIQKNEMLGQAMMFLIGGFALALVSFGTLVTAIGAIGFATAQARIGMVVFRAAMSGISNTATVLIGRLFAATFGLQAFNLATLQGIGPMMMLRMVAGNLGLAFRALGAAMLANPIVLIAAAVIGLGAAFLWAWNHVDGFKQNIIGLFQPMMDELDSLKEITGGLFEAFQPIVGAIQSLIPPAMGALDVLGYGFGFVLGFILTLVIGVFARIATGILQAVGGIINVVSGFVDIVVGLLTGDMDLARRGVGKIWLGIVAIISAPLRLLGINWDAIVASVTAAWNWLKAFVPQMVAAGRDLILGLAGGIAGAVSSVIDSVVSVGKQVIDAARGVFKEQSPSRVFHAIGAFLSIGMANGVVEEAPAVYAAMQSLNNVPALESTVKIGVETQTPSISTPNLPTLEQPVSTPKFITFETQKAPEPITTDNIANVTPQVSSVPALNTFASVTPQMAALPQLETTANVAVPNTQLGVTPQITPLSNLETSASVTPQVLPLPNLETLASVTPQVSSLPNLNTFASVTPQLTALPQLETTANVAVPNTQLGVTPQVSPLPNLETLASVTPQVSSVPTLNTFASVTPQMAVLPQLETMAELNPNIPDVLKRDLNLTPKIADFGVSDQSFGLKPLFDTTTNKRPTRTRAVPNVIAGQTASAPITQPNVTIESISNSFTFKIEGRDVRNGELSEAGAKKVMQQIEREFPSIMERVLGNWAKEVGYSESDL